MIREALQYLIALGKPEIQSFNGRYYAPANALEVLAEPRRTAQAVQFVSLSGLLGLIKNGPDKIDAAKSMLIVDSPISVRLLDAADDEWRERESLAVADAELAPPFVFERFMDLEEFVIGIQTCFTDSAGRSEVLSVVGNISDEAVSTVGDDGVTQEVTARHGIQRAQNVSVPNPVVLSPYRTFSEVSQPTSRYILRLRRGGQGKMPTAALFKTSDVQWRRDAVHSIAVLLRQELEAAGIDIPVIA